MVALIQPTFSGGELSPSLYARVDLERYGNSLKLAKNFIVRPTGGIVNRPGTQFIGNTKSNGQVRLIPFQYSTSISYVLEFGNLYVRFWANAAQIVSGGNAVEVVTPYALADLDGIGFTQSADTMILSHSSYAPRQLVRTSATAFALSLVAVRDGPFQPINTDESIRVASSAATGAVTLTSNTSIFTADHVGTLFYLETKALGQLKPWGQGDQDVAVGTIRRSDGKTYKCTAVSSGGTWGETGGTRPTHDIGREWDGPGDSRTDGSNTWSVGVEWEYLDSGYGIIKITAYSSGTSVTGEVVRRLPAGVVGGVGAAVRTWTPTGDGATKAFTIAAAVSQSRGDYEVSVGGVKYQSDPYYVAPEYFYNGSIGYP